MKYFFKKIFGKKHDEHGIALLFALSMLALLLVMALAFTSNSMFESKAARNSSRGAAARLIAQSAMNQFQVVFNKYNKGQVQCTKGQIYTQDYKITDETAAYPQAAPTTTPMFPSPPAANIRDVMTYDMLEHLTTTVGNSTFFKWEDFYKDYVNWQYIIRRETNAAGNIENHIIGRYAAVVINSHGLDADAISKDGVDEGKNPIYAEERIGAEINEINVRSVSATPDSDTGFAINPTLATKFNKTPAVAPAPVGVFPGTWTDYPTMFSLLTLSSVLEPKFQRWFLINGLSDEKYWIDTTADFITDSSGKEEFHRFNIAARGADNSSPLDGIYESNIDVSGSTYEPEDGDSFAWDNMGSAYPPEKMYSEILLDGDSSIGSADGTPDKLPIMWSKTPSTTTPALDTYDGYGLPWLAGFGYDTNGVIDSSTANRLYANFAQDSDIVADRESGVIARRRQIAANLVDYCDTDSKPTSDIDPTNWTGATTPTYTGNEKTAYINELVIDVSYTTSVFDNTAAASPNRYDHDAAVTVTLSAEIIDIYNISGNYTLTVYGSRRVEHVTIDSSIELPDTGVVVFLPNPLSSGVIADVALKGYTVKDGFPAGNEAVDYDSSTSGGTVSNDTNSVTTDFGAIHITIDKIILNDGTNNVDIAKFNGYTVTFPTYSINGVGQYYVSKSLSVKDPRQNLNATALDAGVWKNLDWKIDIPQGNDNSAIGTARDNAHVTLGAPSATDPPNSNYQCSPNDAHIADAVNTDREDGNSDLVDDGDGDDQKNVSTAYIRNAPMKSPWEIGFIHRGKPYQTINLTKYDAEKAIKYISNIIPGGGSFSDGDANILDQIKMTNEVQSPKKVNLTTAEDEVLFALLHNIRYGCIPSIDNSVPANHMTISSMATGGTEFLRTDIGKINIPATAGEEATKFILAIKTKADEKLVSGTMSDGLYTRAGIVGIVGFSFSDPKPGTPLTTNRAEEEIIGKFINLTEISGGYLNVIILAQTIKDVGGGVGITLDNATKTKITTAFGQFDYLLDGGEYYYADEITSEQKIKLLLRIDGTKAKILRYEYVE
ncbi:MAG: hypothetical protein L3J71_04740 [Victivallaceae bacterium]|nr:hypothetical protein [Victivallaceae bacterium]